MTEADLAAPRSARIGVFLVVALIHVLLVIGLIRAFAPGFVDAVVERAVSTFSVTVTTPPPAPPPPPTPDHQPKGAAAPAGRKALPREVKAPEPKITLPPRQSAPVAASTGQADSAGARDAGAGSGAGGQGSGTGSGAGGNGQGGGGARKVEKIGGDINSARDYPKDSRDLRIGDSVIVYLTVGPDGRAHACKVSKPSKDEAANRITCDLAMQRFRFRPATDAAGNPVTATYGWQQKWFYPVPATER